jgi:hypothetical protein
LAVGGENVIDEKFGRWSVTENANARKKDTWVCRCDCGNVSRLSGHDLRNGKSKSCGCLRREMLTTHGMHKTRFYSIWSNMINRCTLEKSPNFEYYGGRGVKVCDRWRTFEYFKEDLYESYLEHAKGFGEKNTTLDRIDVDGNYTFENTSWSTFAGQSVNKRVSKNNSSGFPGISFIKHRNKWRARFHRNRQEHHVGMFNTIEEAVEAREKAILKFEKGLFQ